MNIRFKELLVGLGLTLLFLLLMDVLSASLLPSSNLFKTYLNINILILIFLSLRCYGSTLPFYIFLVELVHAGFSIQGWAYGTFAGIVVSHIIFYTKDFFNLSSFLSLALFTQGVQTLWFGLVFFLFRVQTVKVYSWDSFLELLPGSIITSLLAPYAFKLFNKMWRQRYSPDARLMTDV